MKGWVFTDLATCPSTASLPRSCSLRVRSFSTTSSKRPFWLAKTPPPGCLGPFLAISRPLLVHEDSPAQRSLIHVRHRKHSDVKVEKRNLLGLLRGKLEGDHTASEVTEPLEYNTHCKTSAVLVATSDIDINGVKVTKLASKVLAKQAGLSLDALSHCTFILPSHRRCKVRRSVYMTRWIRTDTDDTHRGLGGCGSR